MPSILITVCARGGSKGVPRKNISPIAGIPLIGYSIHHAHEFAKLHGADIFLSTDDKIIMDVSARFGLYTNYVRPSELAGDFVGKIAVLAAALESAEKTNGKQYDYLLDLDITSPLRTLDDLEKGFSILENKDDALNLFSVSIPSHNPYFDMVESGTDDFVHLIKTPNTQILARQQWPQVFELNASFYFYRRKFFEEGESGAITKKSLCYEMQHTCFEIDSKIDMAFLEYLIENDKLDFELSKPNI